MRRVGFGVFVHVDDGRAAMRRGVRQWVWVEAYKREEEGRAWRKDGAGSVYRVMFRILLGLKLVN